MTMIVQLETWDGWRIYGDGMDWQIQRQAVSKKDGSTTWKGTNYWTSIEYPVAYAYERMLREKDATITTPKELVEECERVKAELLKAVKKAVRR